MKKILKMLFRKIIRENGSIERIETLEDLFGVAWSGDDIARIFAYMNDDQDGLSTEEILKIADEAYQGVRANG